MPVRKSLTAYHVNKNGSVNSVVLVYVDGDDIPANKGWNVLIGPEEIGKQVEEGKIDLLNHDTNFIIREFGLHRVYSAALREARRILDERIRLEDGEDEKLH